MSCTFTWRSKRLGFALGGLFLTLAASGAPAPGPEFQINTYTFGNQSGPTVRARADGSFVVAWRGGSGGALAGRLLDARGEFLGSELEINETTAGIENQPDVATFADGSFVVVWQSTLSVGDDTSGLSIQGRRFASDGTPLDFDFQVNTYTTSDQRRPRVSSTPDGAFVVVWRSDFSAGPDFSRSIQGQRFDAAGVRLGAQFQVNSHTTGYEFYPEVAVRANGAFIVSWSTSDSPGDDSGQAVVGRRFDSLGNPEVEDFQINGYTTGQQEHSAVSYQPAGEQVVVWYSANDVRARRYAADGMPLGDEFFAFEGPSATKPLVDVDAGGGFVVSWVGEGVGNDPEYGIAARRFSRQALPLGDAFQVNTYTTGYQYQHETAVVADGSFLVVWKSPGSTGDDDSGSSIQGRLYLATIFIDGFESGDTLAWSSTIP